MLEILFGCCFGDCKSQWKWAFLNVFVESPNLQTPMESISHATTTLDGVGVKCFWLSIQEIIYWRSLNLIRSDLPALANNHFRAVALAML